MGPSSIDHKPGSDPEAAGRAVDEFGDEGDHGTKRHLSPRVVSMIALAGTIGTGLFLNSGAALATGGPVGAWLGYTLMGVLVGMMMYCLGEMTCYSPTVGAFTEWGSHYVEPAFGFMIGFNYVLMIGMAFASELSAFAILIGYWDKEASHAGAYITVGLVCCLLLNVVGVRYYGEVEFVFAWIKVLALIGLVIFGLIANLGGVPGHREFIGGRYWRDEPFNDTFMGVQPVAKARFLGFWAVLTRAAFSFGGVEAVAVIAGEARNPRRAIRMATRAVFYRVVGIYVLTMLIIGLNISQHSPELLRSVEESDGTAASSPFVLIATQTGVKVLPAIINAVVITSAFSAANEDMYAVSRTVLALARHGGIPQFFLRTTRQGIPIGGVAVAFCFGCLAYLSCGGAGSNQAFIWLSNLTALGDLICWVCISYCYTRFYRALKLQGIDRRKLALRSWGQPYMAWVCFVFFSAIILFNGFTAFINGFKAADFIAAYLTLPLVLLAYIWDKLWRKSKFVNLAEIDLSGGPSAALVGTRYDPRLK